MHPPCQHAMWSRLILYISSGHVCETPFKTQYLRNSSWTSPELWPWLFTILWRMISELLGLHRSRWWKILPGFTEVLGEISHMIHLSNTLGSTTKRLMWTFMESANFFSVDSLDVPLPKVPCMGNPFIVSIYGLLVPTKKIPSQKTTFPSPPPTPGHLAQNVSNHPTSWASGTLNTWESKSVGGVEVETKRWKNPRCLASWLVVSTHLKNISQIGSFPHIGVKIKNVWNHHLARILCCISKPQRVFVSLGTLWDFFCFWQLLFNTWEPERKHLLSSYGDVLWNLFFKGDALRFLKNVAKSFWTTKCYEHLLRPYQSTKD